MADCTSELTQRPPSLYEQYCCNDNNTGKTFKIRQNNVLKIIFCSDNSPISCEMYHTFLNCSDIFKYNRSAISGYYTMQAPNGSLISVYCDDNAFDNCSQVFKENSSALSGYYIMQAPNGSLISVYCDDNAFNNCSQVFKENSSAVSGYYTMRAPNGSLIFVYCDDNAFDNCSQVFKENSSALSGYYTIRAPNGSLISVYCDFSFLSCSQILNVNSSAPSGYYTIQAPNGSHISVYCDMEGSNCDGKGGWMRVGYLNMSEPNTLCPPGLYSYNFNSISHPLCDRFNSSSGGCNGTFFNTHGISYQHICGQVRGYQYRIADGIYPNDDNSDDSIDGYYVDGVSITHGSNPRKHIWTYICGQFEQGTNHQNCPCNSGSEATLPSYVGNDYYCESAGTNYYWPNDVFTDVLWDGQNCPGIEANCCTSLKMPWFLKTLTNSVTDNIEVRLCTSQGYPDEATPIDIIELFVH